MSIYSFLIAVRSDGQQLMSDTGETTSHLMGLFYRTLRMVDNGIKPLYVFDGAPPVLLALRAATGEPRRLPRGRASQRLRRDDGASPGTAGTIGLARRFAGRC